MTNGQTDNPTTKEAGGNDQFQRFLHAQDKPEQGYVYLAAPYHHPDRQVMKRRNEVVTSFAATISAQGIAVFSPVTYTAMLEEKGGHHPDGWYTFDLHFLHFAKGMLLLQLPGWETSRGILTEMGYAKGLGIPITLVPEEEIRTNVPEELLAQLLDAHRNAGT